MTIEEIINSGVLVIIDEGVIRYDENRKEERIDYE